MTEPTMETPKGRDKDWEDHMAAMLKGMRRDAKGFVGEFPGHEFRSHMRAARREMLLALRSLLDKAIEKTEEPPAEPKASKIVIE